MFVHITPREPESHHEWQRIVKRALGIQQQIGVTRASLELFDRVQPKLQRLACVECMMPLGKTYGDTLVRFIDVDSNYVQLDGVTWGYGGEGPHGLYKVLKQAQVEIDMEKIASIDSEHWFIYPTPRIVDGKAAPPPAGESYEYILNFHCQCDEPNRKR